MIPIPESTELITAVKDLTHAVTSCSIALYFILIVLIFKDMNDGSEIRSLQSELRKTGEKVASEIELLKGVFRK